PFRQTRAEPRGWIEFPAARAGRLAASLGAFAARRAVRRGGGGTFRARHGRRPRCRALAARRGAAHAPRRAPPRSARRRESARTRAAARADRAEHAARGGGLSRAPALVGSSRGVCGVSREARAALRVIALSGFSESLHVVGVVLFGEDGDDAG